MQQLVEAQASPLQAQVRQAGTDSGAAMCSGANICQPGAEGWACQAVPVVEDEAQMVQPQEEMAGTCTLTPHLQSYKQTSEEGEKHKANMVHSSTTSSTSSSGNLPT